MEISGPLNLIPASRPPPMFETHGRQIVGQTPRAIVYPGAMPALPKPQQREEEPRPRPRPGPPPRLQELPAPRVPSDVPRSDPDMSLWKLTREFNDIGDIYQEPPPDNTRPYQQQQQQPQQQQRQPQGLPRQPAPVQQHQQQPNYSYSGNMAQPQPQPAQQPQQRETVPIGYDPNYYRTQTDGGMLPPQQQSEHEPAAYPTSEQRPSPPPQPQQLQAPQGEGVRPDSTAAQPAEGYSVGWITAEAPNELTDGAYYDRDADGAGAGAVEMVGEEGGMYTYSNSAAAGEKTGHYAPVVVPVQQQQMGEEEGMSLEFEQPRQVPYDHRQTRVVLQEDVDFYMALLGGQEPAPASAGAVELVQAEREGRRRSRETEVRQSSRRREEELEDTQHDVDFWMSLMQKA